MGRRRILHRRRLRKGKGVSLPSLSRSMPRASSSSRSAMLKMWDSLSREEKERRKRLLVERYYGGSFEAFKQDVEKRPFRILSALLTIEPAAKTEKPAEKAEKKPKPKKREEKAEKKPRKKPEVKPAKPEKPKEEFIEARAKEAKTKSQGAEVSEKAPLSIEDIRSEVEKRVKLYKIAPRVEKELKKYKTPESIDMRIAKSENLVRTLYPEAERAEEKLKQRPDDAPLRLKVSALWNTLGYHLILRDKLLRKKKEFLEKAAKEAPPEFRSGFEKFKSRVEELSARAEDLSGKVDELFEQFYEIEKTGKSEMIPVLDKQAAQLREELSPILEELKSIYGELTDLRLKTWEEYPDFSANVLAAGHKADYEIKRLEGRLASLKRLSDWIEELRQKAEPVKPEISPYRFLTAEELRQLSDEELDKYKSMIEKMATDRYVIGDRERHKRYLDELNLIMEERSRRWLEERRSKLRELLAVDTSGMSIEELEEFKERVQEALSRFPFAPPEELKNEVRQLRRKVEEVDERIREFRENWKSQLLEKAKAGTLTFEETPNNNPFEAIWDPKTDEERRELEGYRTLSPYVYAKDRAERLIEVMRMLGEKPDVEAIFKTYVEYYKKSYRGYVKDPFEKYWKIVEEAYQMWPEVDTMLQKRLVLAGEVQPITIIEMFPPEKRDAVRVALMDILKGGIYRVEDFRTRKPKSKTQVELNDWIRLPEGWEVKGVWVKGYGDGAKPLVGKAFKILNDVFDCDEFYIDVRGSRAYLREMDRSHVSMFDGEIPVYRLELEPGLYKVELLGGHKPALTSPDAIIKGEDEKGILYRFVRFADKEVRNYMVRVKRIEKIPEEALYPELRIQVKNWISVDAKVLKKLLRKADHNELFKIVVRDGKPKLITLTSDWGDEKVLDEVKTEELDRVGAYSVEYEDGQRTFEPSFEIMYKALYLKDFLKNLSNNARLRIYFDKDKPMKIEVEDDHLEGVYWLAPSVK